MNNTIFKLLVFFMLFFSNNLLAVEPIEVQINSGSSKTIQPNELFIFVDGLEENENFYLAKWKNKLFYKALLVDSNGKLHTDNFKSLKRYYVPIGQKVPSKKHGYIEYSVSFLPNSRFNDVVNNEHYLLLVIAKDAESNKLVFSNLVSFYLNKYFEVTDLKNVPLTKAPDKVKLVIKDSILKEFDANKAEISEQIQTAFELK